MEQDVADAWLVPVLLDSDRQGLPLTGRIDPRTLCFEGEFPHIETQTIAARAAVASNHC